MVCEDFTPPDGFQPSQLRQLLHRAADRCIDEEQTAASKLLVPFLACGDLSGATARSASSLELQCVDPFSQPGSHPPGCVVQDGTRTRATTCRKGTNHMSVCHQCSCLPRLHTSRLSLRLKGVTCTAIRHDAWEDVIAAVLNYTVHVASQPCYRGRLPPCHAMHSSS